MEVAPGCAWRCEELTELRRGGLELRIGRVKIRRAVVRAGVERACADLDAVSSERKACGACRTWVDTVFSTTRGNACA